VKIRSVVIAVLLFTLGVVVGVAAKRIDPSTYRGKSKEEAAKALLKVAEQQAGKGSWERIAVGRVYYLGGMKAEGQRIFDAVTARKPEAGDWFRIGRVYWEAKEWARAQEAFDKAFKIEGSAEKDWAEVGAYHMLQGDRAKAEEMFDRSFQIESGEVWATVMMAGSYLGVPPQQ
jgi:tetratricopeptide (TPR) repeat protein